ncbi:MAG: hypothetical protein ACREJD_00595 [Phycisphaerales bacterium]
MEEQSEVLDPQIELAFTSWPKVVGIISIVWGGLGITCLACGVGGIFLGTAFLPPEMREKPLPPTMHIAPWQAVLFTIGFFMAIVLIVAGVQTTRRTMAGRSLHLFWAVVSFITVAISMYFAWRQTIQMEQWLNDNPDSPFAKGPRLGRGASMAIALCLNAIGLIWPTFCLIWFGLVKRTKESFGAPPNADFI